MSLIIAKPTKPTNAQEAKDSNEFKVGGKIEYNFGGKHKGVIHRVYGNLIDVEPEGFSGGTYFHTIGKEDVIRALDSAAQD